MVLKLRTSTPWLRLCALAFLLISLAIKVALEEEQVHLCQISRVTSLSSTLQWSFTQKRPSSSQPNQLCYVRRLSWWSECRLLIVGDEGRQRVVQVAILKSKSIYLKWNSRRFQCRKVSGSWRQSAASCQGLIPPTRAHPRVRGDILHPPIQEQGSTFPILLYLVHVW